MNNQRRALFLSHGAGPLPLLGDAAHEEMVACLEDISKTIDKPSSIIVVSAHWESVSATVTSGDSPDLIYDYSGFPSESYEIEYPCPGNSHLAGSITKQLKNAGINTNSDNSRGFDHGLFVPLKIMYPEADIPCVQLSLFNSLDPLAHIELGRALQDLTDPSLLLIGSGFSFHNMNAFFSPETDKSKKANNAFECWLLDTCSDNSISEDERTKRLVDWKAAPSAQYCHPREEHLLPLHVCYGYAESACAKSYVLKVLNKESSMYLWENES